MKRIKAAYITQIVCFSNHDRETTELAKKQLYRSMKSIKRSWKRAVQSIKFYQKRQMRMVLS